MRGFHDAAFRLQDAMGNVDWRFLQVVGVGANGELAQGCGDLAAAAEVLAGGRALLNRFALPGARTVLLGRGVGKAMDELERALDQGRRVAVLADGDPLHFGVGKVLVRRFGSDRLRIHPALSSMQLAAARLGIAMENMDLVSLHGRKNFNPLYAAAMRGRTIMALTDASNNPAALAEALRRRGAPPFKALALERLGREDERVRVLDIDAPAQNFAEPNLAVFEPLGRPEFPARLGLPDECFAREKNLITKGPVRAVGLARLGICAEDTVWDLGAGSGAVSVEAASFLPAGGVWAVEADEHRAGLIRENRRRTGACLIKVVQGRAPACLEDLPDPDRVFIGGGLSRNEGVLETAWSRLKQGGRLVAHLTLLGSLERVRRFFLDRGAPHELDMIQASRSAELAEDVHLSALNPIFILSASKPEAQP
ncbi:MAG: precorrin-6y C5,15-methyltransferase (decarboxylating) subunit CbiE [Desulfovibrionaceae bacterium]